MFLFDELKRRNVIRVGIAYVVTAWLLMQLTEVLVGLLSLPVVVGKTIILVLIIGFIPVLIGAWAYELTPEGIKREHHIDRHESISHQTGRKLELWIISILVAAVILLLTDRFWLNEPQESATSGVEAGQTAATEPEAVSDGARKSVAVLPFVNLSEESGNEYFSNGISEELLNVLVRVEDLRVPSRNSSFAFKDSEKDLAEIGKELQVDNVLEGSVRKSEDRIRVTAQLIDVNSDEYLWSETYTRELDDIFAVQDEIAEAIVAALKVTLTGADKQAMAYRPTDNIDAYNKYLLGRHMWNQRSRQSLLDSTTPLRESVELDPNFYEAWAALADAYVLIPEYRSGSIEEYIPLARQAATRALEINPDSAKALTTAGYIKLMYEYDRDGARENYRKAIEIDPEYATAHQFYGELLGIERRTDEALAQFELGAKLDPLAPIMPAVAGWITAYAGRFDEAASYTKKAQAINPYIEVAHENLMKIYAMKGDWDSARNEARLFAEMSGWDTGPAVAVIDALENPELKPQALESLAGPEVPDGPFDKALWYMLLEEPELAMDNIEKSFEAGDSYAIHINRAIIYDSLKDDPRFQAHLAKLNLWP